MGVGTAIIPILNEENKTKLNNLSVLSVKSS